MVKNSFHGAQYLSKGFGLIKQKGISRFVVVPLFINFLLLSIATVYAFSLINEQLSRFENSEYAIVQWIVENLAWLIWPIVVVSVLVVVMFIFAFIANWVAAPFNGLLAEAVEKHLAGESYAESVFNWKDFFKDIPRLFVREWKKLAYFLPRALGCGIVFLLTFWGPFVFLATALWFVFNAWMAAIQYIDYPMDNHKVPFSKMLTDIKARRGGAMGFGATVMLFTMIPVINILVMPAAVAGATNLWFDHFKNSSS